MYHEDVVRKLSGDQQESGVVVRCWYDEEESLPLPEGQELTGLDRAVSTQEVDISSSWGGILLICVALQLKKDEVGIAFYPSGNREILEESELEVVDRYVLKARSVFQRARQEAERFLSRLFPFCSKQSLSSWRCLQALVTVSIFWRHP